MGADGLGDLTRARQSPARTLRTGLRLTHRGLTSKVLRRAQRGVNQLEVVGGAALDSAVVLFDNARCVARLQQ